MIFKLEVMKIENLDFTKKITNEHVHYTCTRTSTKVIKTLIEVEGRRVKFV